MVKRFPSGTYGRQRLQFFPAPFRSPLRAFAVLVFPWMDEKVLLCNIEDRGWCVPSGRVDPGESSMEAGRREAQEEAGAQLDCMLYLGCYRIMDRMDVRWADCFTAAVTELGPITMKEESSGTYLARFEELPEMYHLWNPLTERVFEHAREVISRFQLQRDYL